jgi:hypothetical protein
MRAIESPDTIANGTPSRSASIAARVAFLALASLVGGYAIEPDVSTMITAADDAGADARPGGS